MSRSTTIAAFANATPTEGARPNGRAATAGPGGPSRVFPFASNRETSPGLPLVHQGATFTPWVFCMTSATLAPGSVESVARFLYGDPLDNEPSDARPREETLSV